MPPPPKSARRLPVVGITGGVGAGKSALASLFVRWGGILISGDEIGKCVVARSIRLQHQLARAFGSEVLRNGRIQRSLLAKRAFATRESTRILNRLVHPYLLRELNRQIDQAARDAGRCAVIVDAALLAEWGRRKVRWDCLIGVWAPVALRKRRLRKRGWTEQEIRDRMKGQLSWQARHRVVDRTVKNDSTMAMLERRARFCWDKIVSCD